jgi:hypothetical protein
MVLLGDEPLVDAHFGPFRDSVCVGARQVHGLHQTYHRLINNFGCTRWYSLVLMLNWKLDLVHFEIVLILTQDSCTVCTECTIG